MLLFNSIYMTAKSYQKRNRLYGQLAKYVRQLDGFTGKTWDGNAITVDHYKNKILRIGIPNITITNEQKFALDAAKLYAKERDIKIIYTVVTNK